MAAPEVLVDLNKVAGLRGVREEGDDLVIGAMTTHDTMTRDPLVRRHRAQLLVAGRAWPARRGGGAAGGGQACRPVVGRRAIASRPMCLMKCRAAMWWSTRLTPAIVKE